MKAAAAKPAAVDPQAAYRDVIAEALKATKFGVAETGMLGFGGGVNYANAVSGTQTYSAAALATH